MNSIKNIYANAIFHEGSKKNKSSTFQIKISTSDSNDIIENNLNQISDVTVIIVESLPSTTSKFPRTFSTVLLIGLAIVWISFAIISFAISENVVDDFSNSQMMVIQITIALVISVWLFIYDKKTQENIVDILARLDLRTSEINENVKDLNNDV